MAVTHTPRLGLPQWSSNDDQWPGRSGFNSLHQQIDALAAIDGQGTLAVRPDAGVRGRYYYATDNGLLYRDTGSGWVAVNTDAAKLTGTLPDGRLSSNVVMKDKIQTLTNKTLVDPVIEYTDDHAWTPIDAISPFNVPFSNLQVRRKGPGIELKGAIGRSSGIFGTNYEVAGHLPEWAVPDSPIDRTVQLLNSGSEPIGVGALRLTDPNILIQRIGSVNASVAAFREFWMV